MKIKALYSRGTATIPEDQCILALHRRRIVGVADGVSGLYAPETGPAKFGRWSGGRMAAITLQTIAKKLPVIFLERIISKASWEIQKIQDRQGIPNVAELRAGTTFALANLSPYDSKEIIEIAQMGDAMAVWQKKDGSIHGTPNQVFLHDMEMREEIARLMEKYHGDRAKMWAEFTPFLSAKRQMRTNNSFDPKGYGLLNGDFKSFYFLNFPVLYKKHLRLLLLFTDGFVPYELTGPSTAQELRQRMIALYKQGGLQAILAYTRKIEEGKKAVSHVDHAEATAVAIEF